MTENLLQKQIPSKEQEIVLAALAQLAARPGCRFLEVGSWIGDSTVILASIVKKHGGSLYCIDWWWGTPGTPLWDLAKKVDVYAVFWRRIREAGLQDTVIPLRGALEHFAGVLQHGAFDLVFIDSDHRYSAVQRHLAITADLIRPEGVLCGHDCEGYSTEFEPEVLQAGKEQDVYGGIHCGVILAVSEALPEYAVDHGIWSAVRTRDGGWKRTHLDCFPRLVECYRAHNVVRFRGRYYALPEPLWNLDLTRADDRRHPGVAAADTLQEIKKLIDRVQPYRGPVHLQREAEPKQPRIIESVGFYNLVAYQGRIYALDTREGPVDLTGQTPELAQRLAEGNSFVTWTVEDAKLRIASAAGRAWKNLSEERGRLEQAREAALREIETLRGENERLRADCRRLNEEIREARALLDSQRHRAEQYRCAFEIRDRELREKRSPAQQSLLRRLLPFRTTRRPRCTGADTEGLVETCRRYNIVRHEGRFYACLRDMGPVDLNDPVQRGHPAVLSADTLEEARRVAKESDLEKWTPRVLECYKEHNLVAFAGRFYGIPLQLGSVSLFDQRALSRPEILLGETLEEVKRAVDASRPAASLPVLQERYRGYALFTAGNTCFAVQEGQCEDSPPDPTDPTALRAASLAELKQHIDSICRCLPIEYAGWLPAFKRFGDCGSHPQFAHLDHPPPGYRFTQSSRRFGVSTPTGPPGGRIRRLWYRRHYLRLLKPAAAVLRRCVRCGARPLTALRFAASRDFFSQTLLPRNSPLVLLPSVPFTLGQQPWVVEIEDTTSLFFPFAHNGHTAGLRPQDIPSYWCVKALLESPACRGVIAHVRSTAESIPLLFGEPDLAGKVTYCPLGIPLPPEVPVRDSRRGMHILFTNSWHQNPQNFYVRGGLDSLEAFSRLRRAFPESRLTLRCRLPHDLPARYRDIVAGEGVTVIDRFLPRPQWQKLLAGTDVFLLPAARIHVVSILEAMAAGLALVVSDGWGITEYVKDGTTGIVVRGRYGKVSWLDEQTGLLREDYSRMTVPDPEVVQGLFEALSVLAADPSLRRRIGCNARQAVETEFTLERWNRGLQEAFDRALQQGGRACES